MDRWLIDGQQRLRAIQSYLDNEFPVFNFFWKELNGLEVRRFGNFPFAKTEIRESSEIKLKLLYNRLNFAGTPHTEDQRA